ncbi:MAG: helix-turn-helix transcriptional regulator [Ruminiclostridium sp.]|nr:helix-turn-helix transcriptional regulator [Ruminiclostridium sp.]
MEFNEKLQELRKSKGLTQEELAEALYVSRTAISKWESGRGYPSIDSLREISKFFSVTIDELLSSEKIVNIAERENKSNIRNICDLLFGIADLMSILLIILPLYPKTITDFVYSVPLFDYTESEPFYGAIYWIMFVSFFLIGVIKTFSNFRKIEKARNITTSISIIASIIAVLFLAITRQTYAIVIAFLLLILKGILILTNKKTS